MASSEKKGTRNKLKKHRFYKRKSFWLVSFLTCAILGGIGLLVADRLAEPYRQQAALYDLDRINDLEVPSVILDRNDREIGRIFVQNRSVIPISEVAPIFIDALVAGEDQRFRTHKGVDYIGIVRAFYLNWKSDEVNQGASTVTQQLARNAYDLKNEAVKKNQGKYERKLVEAFLARRIEERYKKEQILEFYLNRIYFGSGYYGIRSASLGYFGKEPKDLTALESATIVGVIKNPTGLSPLNNPEGCRKSRNLVLARMAEAGAISKDDGGRLPLQSVKVNPKPLQRGTTHLYERVADEIRRTMGEDALAAGGFRIHTSIDSRVQEAMEKALETSYRRAESFPGYANQKRADYRKSSGQAPEYLQGAALMIDHETGEVIAHVGGRSYTDAPYDVIELGRRPLGTAFLPFLYAAGLTQGLTPASITEDEPMDNRSVMVGGLEGILGEWGMEVAKPRYEGKVTLRRALESSKIAAAVRFSSRIGLDQIAKTATGFGLPLKDAELLPRLAVGWESVSLKEAVRAISAFARGGETGPQQLSYVDWIDSAEGRRIYQRTGRYPERLEAIDPATAYQIHDMMRGSMERGSAAGLTDRLIEKPFTGAGKTGTTHDFSDNWFLGYNGRVTCGVWLGFLQSGKSIHQGAFSRDLAMPVWEAAMNAAAENFGGKVISQPDSLTEVSICRVSGQRATPYCYETVIDPATNRETSRPAAQLEYFRKGTENLPFCQLHSGAGASADSGAGAIGGLKVIDTTPVRSKAPVLLGEDPYHTEQTLSDSGMVRPAGNRTNVLDSFDLGDEDEPLRLPTPRRLDIFPE